VLDAYPSSVTAHYNLGYDRLERGDFPNAELWFRRTVELQPQHVMALNELGGLARRRSSPREALQHFRLVIEISPTFAPPHFNIAQVYEQLGERESARRHYETFVELDPPQFAPQIAEVRRKLASW